MKISKSKNKGRRIDYEESDSESDGQPLALRRIGGNLPLASLPELQVKGIRRERFPSGQPLNRKLKRVLRAQGRRAENQRKRRGEERRTLKADPETVTTAGEGKRRPKKPRLLSF